MNSRCPPFMYIIVTTGITILLYFLCNIYLIISTTPFAQHESLIHKAKDVLQQHVFRNLVQATGWAMLDALSNSKYC